MTDTLRIRRRAAGGAAGAPASLAASELAYNEQDDTLWYGKGNSGGLATAIVKVGGVAGTGNFQPKLTIADNAPSSPAVGDLWWCSADGNLYVRFDDGSSQQWIVAVNLGSDAATSSASNVGRNLLHNPLFNIAQRGAGPWTTVAYTLDRWSTNFSGGGTLSVSSIALSDADRTAIGDEAATRGLQAVFTGDAAAGGYTLLQQAVEGVRRLGGKTVTFSFWARCTSGTVKIGAEMYQTFGTGGAPSAANTGSGVANTVATAWARYTATIAIASATGKTLGSNGDDLTQAILWLSSGTTFAPRSGSIGVQSNTIQLWGIQLEIGSVATPLEKPDPQQDLAKCQRFYQIGSISLQGDARVAGSTFATAMLFPVAMRSVPTLVPAWSNSNISNPLIGAFADRVTLQYFGQATAIGQFVFGGTWTASADL